MATPKRQSSRSQKKRINLAERLRKQAAKSKPTSNDIRNQGLTVEEVRRMYGTPKEAKKYVPPRGPRKLNKKGGLQRKADKRAPKEYRRGAIPVEKPKFNEIALPAWFTTQSRDIDVSIIVPLYKSDKVIIDQIKSWDLEDDGLSKEIIYVDDFCPNETYSKIFHAWESTLKGQRPIGRIVRHQANGGFGSACNTGASVARGQYLIFLNADTTVSPNWIKPMIELLQQDEEIGLVGNMQLRADGRIDSAGSEWSWDSKSFQHIGRTIYKGKKLSNPIALATAPSDVLSPKEREMVTGCCFAIRNDLWRDLEGFDKDYKVGYWEDSDLCMRVRADGYKIYYQPNSRIFHSVGHSNAGGHPHVQKNRQTFYERWVDTGRIDKFINKPRSEYKNKTIKSYINGKVVGCVIACNEEEFLEASVDSASSMVHEWVFVIGGNKFAMQSGMCDPQGYPTDNTLEIAYKCAKKYGGRVIEPPGRVWRDKVEMRNAYVQHLKPGYWMFMLDGDEVYKENQLWKIARNMRKYEVQIYNFWVFWNNMDTVGTGKWMSYPQERIVHWKPGFEYRNGNHLHVSTASGQLARSIYPTFDGRHEKMFYHYSWVRPIEKIRQKLAYYSFQTGNTQAGEYVDNVFLRWRDTPHQVEGMTHPMKGGGTEPFPGVHPKSIQKLIDQGKLDF